MGHGLGLGQGWLRGGGHRWLGFGKRRGLEFGFQVEGGGWWVVGGAGWEVIAWLVGGGQAGQIGPRLGKLGVGKGFLGCWWFSVEEGGGVLGMGFGFGGGGGDFG